MQLSRAQPGTALSAEQDRTIQSALKFFERFCDQLEKDTSPDNADPWDAFGAHFDVAWKDGLTAMHGGDCTAIACTCERCYAEHLYCLPSSVKWRSKHEGHRLFEAWSQK